MEFTIPIYIEERKEAGRTTARYSVRPLFLEKPLRRGEQLQRALNRLAGDLRQELLQSARRWRHDRLIEWTRNPDLEESELRISLRLKRASAETRFLVVSFPALDRRIAFTPAVPGLWFEFRRGQDLKTRATEVLTRHFRELEKKGDAQINLERIGLQGKARVGFLELNVPIAQATPAEERSRFALLGGERKMSGSEELENVGRSLNALYPDELDRATQRDAEIAELSQLLNSDDRRPILLLGPRKAGKTAIIHETVHRSMTGDRRKYGSRNQVWLLSPQRLISGMMYVGQWEERCEAVIDELSDVAGVLCAENLLDLVHSGGAGPGDSLAAFLLPYLQQGELQLVAEATPAELDACRRLFPAFSDAFQILRLEEFDDASALKALEKVIASRERQTGVEAGHGSAPLIHRLFRRFVPYAAFPGKAVKFLNDAFESCVESGDRTLTHDLLLRRFVDHTGLPELFLRDELPLDYNEALARFNDRIIGQPEACRRATDVITTFKAGMNDASRPVATLLFSGPTGVGKTALARAMAECLFGGTATPPPESPAREMERLIRLDMSEYSLPGSAARLLTGNDGGPSEFIKRVRRQPFVVVLLDEIEKAAPEIFDVFLNVFDEGRLTDRLGRETLFRSAVIVMTSNLGASGSGGLGFGPQSPPSYDDEAMRFFRPEFFNRIDSVVAFAPLERDSILQIAEKELRDLGRREGFTAANLQLVWADKLIAHLADIGFDLKLGARPLQRAIEHEVIAPLARFLVARPGLRDRRIRLNWSSGSGLDLSAD